MALFSGVSAFPITPIDADGIVDTDALGRLLVRIATRDVGSIGLLGSTGLYAYLTRAERRRAVRAAVEAIDDAVPLMVGVGALRTDEAVALARDAAVEGADGLLMAPMSYTPLTQDEAFAHYVAVAGATDLPLCVYDNPTTTHFRFGNDLLARLALVPNIAGVKMPLPADGTTIGDELAKLRANGAGRMMIGYSGDWGVGAALLAGADGFYSVIAGFLPEPFLRLARAAMAGNRDEVDREEAGLRPLLDLCRAFGGLRVAHCALQALGFGDAALPRPLLALSGGDAARVRAAIGR